MKKLLPLSLISLIALISLGLNVYLLRQSRSENLVVEVVDGDTFQLKSGKRVRLMGVDAPEYNRCAGPEAKARLEKLILGKVVNLKEGVKESYGRTLALVYEGNTLINKVMLEEGWGRPDYRKNSQRDILTKVYHLSKDKNLGLWSFCLVSNPPNPSNPSIFLGSQCFIKGNIDPATSAKFYHLPNCSHYKEITLNLAYGEQWFCSEKEAKTAGFKKASSCP